MTGILLHKNTPAITIGVLWWEFYCCRFLKHWSYRSDSIFFFFRNKKNSHFRHYALIKTFVKFIRFTSHCETVNDFKQLTCIFPPCFVWPSVKRRIKMQIKVLCVFALLCIYGIATKFRSKHLSFPSVKCIFSWDSICYRSKFLCLCVKYHKILYVCEE